MLLVSTSQGTVGRDVAALVGASLLNLVDAVIREQGSLPLDRRRGALVVVDEMQSMLSELGKFGASFVLAALSRSISSQVAPLASPERAAVKTRNLRQSFEASDVWDASTVLSAEPTSWYGSARRCALTLGIDGKAPSMASPAGLLSTSSFAMAHLNIVRILCRTRRAVSGCVDHMGVRTASRSLRLMASICLLPILGKVCRSRV